MCFILSKNQLGVRFDLAYEAAARRWPGIKEFLEPGSVSNNMTFTGEYTRRIVWMAELTGMGDDGFLRIYLNLREL